MSLLWIVRIFAVIVMITSGISHAPWDQIEMFFNPGVSIIVETGHSLLLSLGTYTVYIMPVLAVMLAFAAIPRWRFGTRALALCYFAMTLGLLTRLEEAVVWQENLSTWTRVHTAAGTLYHSLPPFLLGVMLLHPLIAHELTLPRDASRNA